MATFKRRTLPDSPVASADAARAAELQAMPDPRHTDEWKAWRAWFSDGERAQVNTDADVRHLLRSEKSRRRQRCLRLRAEWRQRQREYLRQQGWPVEWAQSAHD